MAQALSSLQSQPTDGSTHWPWGESVIAELIDELEVDGPGLGVSRQNGLPAVQRRRLNTLAAARINNDFDLLGRHENAAPEGQGHLMLLRWPFRGQLPPNSAPACPPSQGSVRNASRLLI